MKVNLINKICTFTKHWNEYNNPFYVWWECQDWFHRPNCHIYCGKKIWFFGLPITDRYYNKILDIRFSAIGWKWKYERIEHEWDPYISITLFKKWQLIFIFNYITKDDEDSSTRNIATWEAMLDMVYNNKTLYQVVNRHQWCKSVDNRKEVITIKDNLSYDGFFEYLIEYENMRNV